MQARYILISGLMTFILLLTCMKDQEAAVENITESSETVSSIASIEPVEVGTMAESATELITEVTTEITTEPINLGEYKLTAYCSCKKCCGKWADNRGPEVVGAIGKVLTAGYSIAVDPKVIPYGSIVIINGKEYEAMDCGGAIKGNRIDVYFNSHEEALEFGVQYANVYLKKVTE